LDLKLSNVPVGVAKTFWRTSANEASMGTPGVFNLHLKLCKHKMQRYFGNSLHLNLHFLNWIFCFISASRVFQIATYHPIGTANACV
jgi:hypothetical protein